MIFPPVVQAHSSYLPNSVQASQVRRPPNQPFGNEPPRKPDWLLIMVSILFLLTLLIAWLVGVPHG